MLVFLCTLAPIVAAFVVYYNPQWWPDDASNYGTLVTPQRPMPAASELKLTTLDGQPFDLRTLKGNGCWWPPMARLPGKLRPQALHHAQQPRQPGQERGPAGRVWFITDDAPVPDKVLEATRALSCCAPTPASSPASCWPASSNRPRRAGRAHLDHRSAGQPDDAVPADADGVKVRKDVSKLVYNSRVG